GVGDEGDVGREERRATTLDSLGRGADDNALDFSGRRRVEPEARKCAGPDIGEVKLVDIRDQEQPVVATYQRDRLIGGEAVARADHDVDDRAALGAENCARPAALARLRERPFGGRDALERANRLLLKG